MVECSMGAARFYKGDAPLDTPAAVHMSIVQTEENRGRIQGHLCMTPDNTLECQRIAMSQSLIHPDIAHGKAAGVKCALVGKRFHYPPVIERIARFHLIPERIPFPFDF